MNAWDILTITRIKVIALIVFFILAIIISAGGIGPEPIGFKYWHQPGAFADSINGVAKTFVVAGTLYAGTEMYAFKILSNQTRADRIKGLVSQQESLRIPARLFQEPSSRFSGES